VGATPATPPTPLPQHRKINSSLQNALAEKAALKFCMVGCDVLRGVGA